jgi:uncharacterized membrane protein
VESGTRGNCPVSDSRDVASRADGAQAAPRLGSRLDPLVRAFLVRAVLWCVAFGAAHLLGLRAYTSLLSGTSSYGMVQQVLGVAYIVLYAGLVFFVPVLVIAALLVQCAVLAIDFRTKRDNTKGPTKA